MAAYRRFSERAGEALAAASDFVRRVDLPLAAVTAVLVAYGLVVVWSASLAIPDASLPRQAAGAVIGTALAILAARFDYRRIEGAVRALFVADCLLILAPLVPGLSYEANGITGWVQVPLIGLTLQTSELAKPVTVFLMAACAARYRGRIVLLRDYVRLCLILSVPFVLILLQPDLGTGLVILVSGAAVIVLAGPRRSWVVATILLMVGIVAFVLVTDQMIDDTWGDERSLIKAYQMNRLLIFLNPQSDTTGSGYNLQQALIAVGSGGLLGKGVGNATQSMSGFLPEAHTDFVFALLAEEFGFVGGLGLIALYVALVFRSIRIAREGDVLFGRLAVLGIVAMWTFQIFENIGMCLALMPITGIPLPFISFGSSSMIAQLACVGLVQSVCVHRAKLS